MAARSPQDGAERRALLRQRQRVQERALDAFDKAASRTTREEARRAEAISRHDSLVASARSEQALALAVVAELVGHDEDAAALAGVDVSEVRAARKAASADGLRDQVANLRGEP
jgi:hypothetical protein